MVLVWWLKKKYMVWFFFILLKAVGRDVHMPISNIFSLSGIIIIVSFFFSTVCHMA